MSDKITFQDYVSLKEYFEDKFLSSDKALILAFESLKIRLENIDKVTELTRSAMSKDIQELRESRARLEGKASQQSVVIAYIIATVSMIIGIVGIILK